MLFINALLFTGTYADPIPTGPPSCAIQKIRVTGAQVYNGFNWSKQVMKSLGHFNGVYELDESEIVNSRQMWTKHRADSRSVSLQWADDIFGATGWILTNNPGQVRFFSYSIDDCPNSLGNWQLLEYGNKTVIGNEKTAGNLRTESLGDFKPIPNWVIAQLDDEMEFKEFHPVPVADIFTMLAHVVPDKHEKLHTFGCNGISDLKFYATPGIPTDPVTAAINEWKRCVTCAQNTLGATADPYMFDPEHNTCLNTPGNIERALCDCDYGLASQVQQYPIDDYVLTNKDCIITSSTLSRNQQCCFSPMTGIFTTYNSQTNCCSKEGSIQSIGTC